ncbi:hypothetical protein LSH36_391g02056 [Paralvinella palmiformis]|uniref:EGF-like domain-containing protein n=1 Tax=Paralvinella palmiformis TaxID=53620 RepID=A0AAD9JE88_9ANNE|nr:hypothetical protein LSH36_391g02056 [Paralvinella palmiformis]
MDGEAMIKMEKKYFFHDNPTWSINYSEYVFQVACSTLYQGCSKCSADKCEECVEPLVLGDGSCKTCPSNCIKCSYSDSTVTCDQCSPYYTLDNGQCVSCSDECPICELDADKKPICKGCPEKSAIIDQSICDKCPENCLDCSKQGQDTICLQGKCKTGYTRNSLGDLCIKCPENCVGGCHYSSVTKAAACNDNACADNFAVDSNSGLCTACPADCSECYVENTKAYCTVGKCMPGSVRNDETKLCVKCPEKCEYCYMNSQQEVKCVKCTSGSGLHPIVTKTVWDVLWVMMVASYVGHISVLLVTTGRRQTEIVTVRFAVVGLDKMMVIIFTGCQVTFCSYCIEESKCLECNPGYILNSEGTSCISTTPCLTGPVYDADSGSVKCSQCSIGWYATNTDTLKKCSNQVGCQSSSITSHMIACSQCSDGYIVYSGVCHKCPEQCMTCTFDSAVGKTECSTCNDGFKLTDVKTCQECPIGTSGSLELQYCDNCDSDPNMCKTCSFGYISTGNSDPACVGCSANGDFCQLAGTVGKTVPGMCTAGYVMKADADRTCKPCPEGFTACYIDDSDAVIGFPYLCKTGYVYVDSDQSCQACGQSCKYCSEPGHCDVDGCLVGFGRNEQGICQACADNCQSCDTNGADQCDSGQCKSGYYLKDGDNTCETCGANCKVCDTNNDQCDAGQCDSGYYFDDSDHTCKACTDNCQSCDSNGADQCDSGQCKSGFYLKDGDNTCETCGANCKVCDTNNDECDAGQCDSSYYFDDSDNTCKACADNCQSCDTNGAGKCDAGQCSPGYILDDSEQTCKVAACKTKSDLSEDPNTMYHGQVHPERLCDTTNNPNSEGCQYYVFKETSSADSYCPQDFCKPGFVWMLGPDTSASGYKLGSCDRCPDGCLNCILDTSGSPKCLLSGCAEKYTIKSDGTCIACPPECTECEWDQTAGNVVCKVDKCETGYSQTSADICIDCPPKATSCRLNSMDPTQLESLLCGTGSVKTTEGTCFSCPGHCDLCTIDEVTTVTSCQTCSTGYILDPTGTCLKCPDFCTECTYDITKKVSVCKTGACTDGYIQDPNTMECSPCPDGCLSCSYREDIATTNCDICLDPYYEQTQTVGSGQQQYCTACGDNVLKCSSLGGTKLIETCASGTGKYPEDGVSSTDCKGCPTNCATCKSSESSPGCDTCEMGCRRYKDTDNHYKCQKCTDSNCQECAEDAAKCTKCLNTHYLDSDQCTACSTDLSCIDCGTDGVCKTCVSGTYLSEDKTCIACPGNCAQCDDTGCIKCNNEWLINKGQCGNCPFHCKKCSMASDSKTLKCDSKECYDGFGLDASRDNCIDCPSLTGVKNCATCTDVDPATNKSTCMSCEAPRYALDENSAVCLDCNDIDSCGACVDRPRVCTSCTNGLETSRNKTICGAMCYLCYGDNCPETPTIETVDYVTLDLVFCPEYCIVRTKWEYSGAGEDGTKGKILHREYGCSGDVIEEVSGASGCRQDNKNCAMDKDNYEVCCYKGYNNFNSRAPSLTKSTESCDTWSTRSKPYLNLLRDGRFQSLADPDAVQDAATKSYVDTKVERVHLKAKVSSSPTSDVDLILQKHTDRNIFLGSTKPDRTIETATFVFLTPLGSIYRVSVTTRVKTTNKSDNLGNVYASVNNNFNFLKRA